MGLHLPLSSPLFFFPLPSLLFFPFFFLPSAYEPSPTPRRSLLALHPRPPSHRALNLPQRHFLLFCRIVGVNLASSTCRSFHESSSLSFLIFAIPLEHLSPLIGFFVDESSNYSQRSWVSTRWKLEMILHERVPIIVWLEAYCFFFRHPSYSLYDYPFLRPLSFSRHFI